MITFNKQPYPVKVRPITRKERRELEEKGLPILRCPPEREQELSEWIENNCVEGITDDMPAFIEQEAIRVCIRASLGIPEAEVKN